MPNIDENHQGENTIGPHPRSCSYELIEKERATRIWNLAKCPYTVHLYVKPASRSRGGKDRLYSGTWVHRPGTQLTLS